MRSNDTHRRRAAVLLTAVTALAATVVPPLADGVSADVGDDVPPGWVLPDDERDDQVVAARSAWTPWRTPTMPPPCSAAQAERGDVEGCLLTGPGGTNAERGFGTPPFPVAAPGEVLPWENLRIGDEGPMVTTVQVALNEHGASISTDGSFGPVTEAAVKEFQRSVGLRATGVVNEATADALGVENRESGAFPPAGWNWLGWGYNGSPALDEWESRMVPSRAVPGFSAGRVTGQADVIRLFEGFMAEMTALGYDVDAIGSYVFRCTSGTGKTCEGRTPASLSNHSWGIALDMNTVDNPEITYYSQDGRSACEIPMRTDMPRALIRAAERWGLYWGGYGWGGGCSSPDEWRSSIHRDPMHFEFRGDVLQARAIAAHNAGRRIPRRWCGDVVQMDGTVAVGIERICSPSDEAPAGAVLAIQVGNDTATAAAVSVTASGGRGTVFAAQSCSGRLRWRPLIAPRGAAISVGTVVPLSQGRLCIRLPEDVRVTITRTAAWSAAGTLGLRLLDPPTAVRPGSDGAVRVAAPGDAAWVSVRPAATVRVAASRCADPSSTGRRVTWVAGAQIDELQAVPLTRVDDRSVWCLDGDGVAVTHVAHFREARGLGIVAGARRLRDDADLAPRTAAVVVQVRTPRGPTTLSTCSDWAAATRVTVPASSQVSTVLLTFEDTAAPRLCLDPASGARVDVLARFTADSTLRSALAGPVRVARLRT